MIRVLLVEDHAALRQALGIALKLQPDIDVVGQTGSLAEARRLLNDVDVAIIDLDLEDGNGLELISDVRRDDRPGAALVLTASENRLDAYGAIVRGAAGVLHKSSGLDEITEAVRRVAAGETLFSAQDVIELVQLAGEMRAREREAAAAIDRLTPRELEVLRSLAHGLTDREIAAQLSVSHETARTHMVNVLGKLGVTSRLQALIFAVRHGIVTIE